VHDAGLVLDATGLGLDYAAGRFVVDVWFAPVSEPQPDLYALAPLLCLPAP